MDTIESLIESLPDPEGARRFFSRLRNDDPAAASGLSGDKSLLADTLTLVAYSPLLSTTILKHPEYLSWLAKERLRVQVREKEELVESLARFSMTITGIDAGVMLARYRRRELLRIYLKDIRNLGTIAEVTEEISNLADAILEHALRVSIQELDNRYGMPLETDEKGRSARAGFCVAALGKLGSKELNYSSDIDLLFIYSADGTTSAAGSAEPRTNREYFVKLSEKVAGLVGRQAGEGAAYRVDLRLRPHGRAGAIAVSVREAGRYYTTEAQLWEKQVLIRSRCAAGDPEVFSAFFESVAASVFSKGESVANALESVLRSKNRIEEEKSGGTGFDVKLGRGGVREIEFIGQALQLAYAAADRWLRAPHTLISLSRLADRGYLSEKELTELFEAYSFLRKTEHRLQMENGLQTHQVPDNEGKQALLAARMGFASRSGYLADLAMHTGNVSRAFRRFFDKTEYASRSSRLNVMGAGPVGRGAVVDRSRERTEAGQGSLYDRLKQAGRTSERDLEAAARFADGSPPFGDLLAANPSLIEVIIDPAEDFPSIDYRALLMAAVSSQPTFAEVLAGLRVAWTKALIRIAAFDIEGKIDILRSRWEQTKLAEAGIEAALFVSRSEMNRIHGEATAEEPLVVLGLGKLGVGGMDFHSDLDLLLAYDEGALPEAAGSSCQEYFSKAVSEFVSTLSNLTREGSLYRVDLRLRPDGRNGATSTSIGSLYEYVSKRAAIWELLAYTKVRGVAGPGDLHREVEETLRGLIHTRAGEISAGELAAETLRIREKLREAKDSGRRSRGFDIKYGEGGLQDIYFAIRFLQLRDDVRDKEGARSTTDTLSRLFEAGSLSEGAYERFGDAYRFLTKLDHSLRLFIGRSSVLTRGNQETVNAVSARMGFGSKGELLGELTRHRLNARKEFLAILG